jgi:4-amino-4-deoxy-L-arabinose transferase-like glycosyltransferase
VRPFGRSLRPWLAFGALLGIVVAAVVLRFADLATNPGGLYGDEAAEGLDAVRLLRQPGFHADFGVWFTSDGGREALFAYVVAAVFHFTDATVLALRAAAAGIGVAGVLAIWLLGRRFGTWVGLTAAAWAAGSLWLVCVSRDGMRNTIVPLFGALALMALMAWARRPSQRVAMLAGAATALAALYTYQPLKLLPVLVVVWLWWLRRVDAAAYRKLRAGLMPFAAAFLVVAAPMLLVALTNPANYFGRVVAVSPLNPGVQADSNAIVHTLRTLGMFGLTGDPNGRHDVAGLPLLPLPLAALAVLGVVRLWRLRRDPAHALILWALPIFMIPPLLAIDGGSPHFLRALGLAAPLGVTLGLGAAEMVEQLRSRRGRAWTVKAAIVGAAVGLSAIALGSGLAYLGRPVADRYVPFSYNLVALADAADRPGSLVIADEWSAAVVRFIDFDTGPTVVAPGAPISDPGRYESILATSRADLVKGLGESGAAGARPVAWDLDGEPVVWEIGPGDAAGATP